MGDSISQHMTRSHLHTTNIYGAGYTQWRRMDRGVLTPYTHNRHRRASVGVGFVLCPASLSCYKVKKPEENFTVEMFA